MYLCLLLLISPLSHVPLLGNNLSWLASKFTADDDSSLGTDGELTSSQGDLGSEGSEWLMAGNDDDDDDAGQGRYMRRRPALQRRRQQRVLQPRR